jgi:nuclear protein localization family protein 4
VQHVLQELHRLRAFDVVDSRHGQTAEDATRRVQLAHWLSDWHLVSFIGTVDLFSPVSTFGVYTRA